MNWYIVNGINISLVATRSTRRTKCIRSAGASEERERELRSIDPGEHEPFPSAAPNGKFYCVFHPATPPYSFIHVSSTLAFSPKAISITC